MYKGLMCVCVCVHVCEKTTCIKFLCVCECVYV